MKKISYQVPIAISMFMLFFSFIQSIEITAKPEKYRGLYVYYLSKPVNNIDTLGRIQAPAIVWANDPETMLNLMVKRAFKTFPDAEGILFSNKTMSQAYIVKYK